MSNTRATLLLKGQIKRVYKRKNYLTVSLLLLGFCLFFNFVTFVVLKVDEHMNSLVSVDSSY